MRFAIAITVLLLGSVHAFPSEPYTVTTIVFPGKPGASTNLAGINDNGQVVGNVYYGTTPEGFLYDSVTGKYSALMSMVSYIGINDSNDFIGDYGIYPPTQGFVHKAGAYLTLLPAGATSSEATAINNLGEVLVAAQLQPGPATPLLFASGRQSPCPSIRLLRA